MSATDRIKESLLTANHLLLKEWDYAKNTPLRPADVSIDSKKKVWWVCSICGYSWQSVVYSRTSNGRGCPECGRRKQGKSFRKRTIEQKGSLRETHPALCEEWNYTKNSTIYQFEVHFSKNR